MTYVTRCSLGHVQRSKGDSLVERFAYWAREVLEDERYGAVRDHRKSGDILFCSVISPPRSPGWVSDLGRFPNEVEKRERRIDAVLAREAVCNWPRELPAEAVKDVVDAFAKWLCDRYKTAVWAFAHPHRGVRRNLGNGDVHFVMATRDLKDGVLGGKITVLDRNPTELRIVKGAWRSICLAALAKLARPRRAPRPTPQFDPMPEVKEPKATPAVVAMERRGETTRVWDLIVSIRAAKRRLRRLMQLRYIAEEMLSRALAAERMAVFNRPVPSPKPVRRDRRPGQGPLLEDVHAAAAEAQRLREALGEVAPSAGRRPARPRT